LLVELILILPWFTTNQLNAAFTPPATFHDGDGVSLPLLEYRQLIPDGVMFQAGYDSRKDLLIRGNTDCGTAGYRLI
jgi:hypothetical protein